MASHIKNTLLGITGLLALGCQSADDDEAASLPQMADAVARIDAGAADAGLARPFDAQISTLGNGCPKGTWSTTWLRDGSALLTFSSYDVSVDGTQTSQGRDCVLSVTARSELPLAYTLERVSFGGYAYLQQGASATVQLGWARSREISQAPHRLDLTGPYDDAYLLKVPEPAEPDWSRCGTAQTFSVFTRASVRREVDAGAGYLNLTTIDAEGAPTLRFAIRATPCTPPSP